MPCRDDNCCPLDDLDPFGFNNNFTSLNECELIEITTEELDRPQVGTPYSFQLEYTGGVGTVTWTIVSGSLPNGLTLSTSGLISGTPTEAIDFSVTVMVMDADENFCRATLTQRALSAECTVISITTSSLPDGDYGDAYSQALASTGGTGPNTWTLESGALPTGLSLSSAGLISGTPTESGPSFSFTVKVTDANGEFCTKAFTLQIEPDFTESTLTGGIIPFWVYAPNTDELHAFGINQIINYVTPATGAGFTTNIIRRAVYNPVDGFIYGGQLTGRIMGYHNPATGTDAGSVDYTASLPAGGAFNQVLYGETSLGAKYLVAAYYAGSANSRIVVIDATTQAIVATHTRISNADPLHGIIFGDTAYIGSANVTGQVYKLNLLSPATAPTLLTNPLAFAGDYHPPCICSVNNDIYWPFQGGASYRVFRFDPATDTFLAAITLDRYPSQCIDFPPDGKVIASSFDTRGFRIIDPLTDTLEASIGTTTFGILNCCIMAPNGRVFGGVGNITFGSAIAIITSTTPYP